MNHGLCITDYDLVDMTGNVGFIGLRGFLSYLPRRDSLYYNQLPNPPNPTNLNKIRDFQSAINYRNKKRLPEKGSPVTPKEPSS